MDLLSPGGNAAGADSFYKAGGMYIESGSNPSVRNSILWNNGASSGTGTITATIALDNSSWITLTHSLVQGSGALLIG